MSNKNFWSDDIVAQIVDPSNIQIKKLASIAGISLDELFRKGDFRGVDLRNQDLRGIYLEDTDFTGAIIDNTTLIEGKRRPISDKSLIENEIIEAIFTVFDLLEIDSIWKSFYKEFRANRNFIFCIGNPKIAYHALDTNTTKLKDINIAKINSGYFSKRMAIIQIRSASIAENLIDSIEKSFPSVIQIDSNQQNSLRQFELPFADAPIRNQSAKTGLSSLDRTISNLKRLEKINQVWVVIDVSDRNSIKNIQRQISSLIKRDTRLKYIFLSTDTNFLESSWRKSIISNHNSSLLEYSKIANVKILDALRVVEKSAKGKVIFSSKFKSEISIRHSSWDTASQHLIEIIKNTVPESNSTPINIGIAELKKTL